MDEPLLPLAIQLRDRRCVCVGAGTVAARRVPLLLEAGGRVTVIAPALHPRLQRVYADGAFDYVSRPFAADDLAEAFFVLAATGVPAIDASVAAEGLGRGALVCVAGDPAA